MCVKLWFNIDCDSRVKRNNLVLLKDFFGLGADIPVQHSVKFDFRVLYIINLSNLIMKIGRRSWAKARIISNHFLFEFPHWKTYILCYKIFALKMCY